METDLHTLSNEISKQFIELLSAHGDIVSALYTIAMRYYNFTDCDEGNILL